MFTESSKELSQSSNFLKGAAIRQLLNRDKAIMSQRLPYG